MAFDNSCTKAVSSASPGHTPKRCQLQLFLAALGQVVCCGKALDLRSLNLQFQHDWPKDKKIQLFQFFLPENLENFRSTELYGAPLKGSTIFLKRISTCRMSMESYRLAELKYAIFSRTGHKTKKSRCSELFLWTVFKHGLLEGSTILYHYSYTSRTPLESSRLGQLK